MKLRIGILWLALGAAAAQAFAQGETATPQTYGTSAVSYVEVPVVAFLPFDSTVTYAHGTGSFARYTPGCGLACLMAPLRLPSGARIVSLELDGIDTDSFDSVWGTLYVCDKFAQACALHPTAGAGDADCLYAPFICSGKAFAAGAIGVTADLTGDAIVVDNTASSYFLAGGGDESAELLGGMIVGYVLQVSPQEIAHFADVPPSNPQFQFIEALYASGVTAGCGSGNFCPNASLTRGQMAVFLAKALGLQWP